MKKIKWMFAAAIIGVAFPAFAFFGRDGVGSLWPTTPVIIDGRAVEWADLPLLDEDGIGFRAMNDAANLYLLINGTASDGRLLLSGKSGQTITLWFLKPDRKTKNWGITIDFSQENDPSVQSPTQLSDWGVVPEKVVQQGLELSTTTFPTEIEWVADLSSQRGRQPVYEMRIPLSMIEHKGRSIAMDFVTSDITFERRAQLLSLPPPAASKRENPQNGGEGGHHHHGGGAPGGGTADSAADLPKRLNLHLSVGLAKEPNH